MMTPKPLAIDARNAAALFGLSVRTWRRLDAAGGCPRPLRLGGAVRWSPDELAAWRDAGCPARAEWERNRPERASGAQAHAAAL